MAGSRLYGLSRKETEIILAKFPNEDTVRTNNDVAEQSIENDQLPADPETVRRQMWTIYHDRFCPKENCEGFPGYDQRASQAKDAEFLTWLKQKYWEWLKNQNFDTPSPSAIVIDDKNRTFLTNPFIPKTGRVDEPQLFFNREREIRQIFEELNSGSSVALIGEEGIGKSSLLWAICQQAESYLSLPRKAVYLDLNEIRDEDDFYRALCDAVGIPESKDYSLNRALRSHRVLLTIDNVGKLTWKGFTRSVRDRLRSLAEGSDAPLKLILAASESLENLFKDSQGDGKTSPLSGICLEENIKPWDEATARAFIESRLAKTAVRFTEEEIIYLVHESGGHPRRVMQLCYQTYSRYIENVQ